MTLTPAFAVSAMNPLAYGYDAEAPDAPYASAYLQTHGGFTGYWASASLAWQADNDELLFGDCGVDSSDENDITDYHDQLFTQPTIHLTLILRNMEADHQILVVWGLKKYSSLEPAAQFFVGTEFVRSEPIDDEKETIALLLDSPGEGYVYLSLYCRLAGNPYDKAYFTGVEGFIL